MFKGKQSFAKKFSTSAILLLVSVMLLQGMAAGADPFWDTLNQPKVRKAVPLTNETVANLVEKLKPAVVNISVTEVVKTGSPHGFSAPFGNDDQFKEFWKRFFGNQEPREFKRKGLGSGFIINKEGYIVTNNHVVQKAKDITVILHNKEQYPAKVIGTDPKTDIALIKVEAKKDFIIAPLGDSDTLRDGESVIAIGNPFGLAETVTSGIVSAKGRTIGAGPYDDFIQTDASINPGNSGGPLINYYGEVVGINTAIVAAGQGIGFAVPINMAKEILVQLKEKGKVTRGWLGVSIQEITPELAKSFGLQEEKGALISDVVPGGPADKAGFKRGDVILELNGKTVKDYHELPRMVASMPPGEKVTFKVLRDGKEMMVPATVGELKDEEAVKPSEEVERQLGISLQPVTPEIAAELGLKKAEGVVVTNVEPGGLAGEAGIQRGDVILEVDRNPVNSLKEFNEMLKKAGKSMLFLVYRSGSTFFVTIKISPKEN
ncbi:MAG: DegQ family serine endoprotease [Nitrospirae bacterium]|nr:DegQ family serine endoprotease [Nitrospirota bacterium]